MQDDGAFDWVAGYGRDFGRASEVPRSAGPAAVARVCMVFVVSDVRLFRDGLTGSLDSDCRIRVVGAGTVAEALPQIARLCPDVVLLDVAAPSGLALARPARMAAPRLRIVAFAVAELTDEVIACAEAGISGYVAKDGSVADVIEAVLGAVSGELVCPPRIAASLFERVATLAGERKVCSPLQVLTRREIEIAELVARGLPNKVIARDLRLGVPTIKNHVHNILQKLKLQRRGEIGGLGFAGAWPLTNPMTDRPRPS